MWHAACAVAGYHDWAINIGGPELLARIDKAWLDSNALYILLCVAASAYIWLYAFASQLLS